MNGRSIAIISEAVGGTNVDNCPHSCATKPCGPLANCLPNLDSYECQCNPSNIQCNKAEELTVVQATVHSGLTSTFNFTDASVDGNRSSISATNNNNNNENPLNTPILMKPTTTTPEVYKLAAAAVTSAKTTITTSTTALANEQHEYNAEIIDTLSQLNSKSPVIQQNEPYAKYNEMAAKDHSDSKSNDKENENDSSGSSESDGTNDEDYYDDSRPSTENLDGIHSIQKQKISNYDDYDYKSDNLSDGMVDTVIPVVSSTTISSVNGGDNFDEGDSNGNGGDHTDTITTMNKNIDTKLFDGGDIAGGGIGGISTDDDVTKVFGRYMSIDTEKLLKKEQMLLLKSKQQSYGDAKKGVKQQMAKKKHYIPIPLLEPQSPSLDDEIEIDIMLPTTTKNDHEAAATATVTTTQAPPATTTAKVITTTISSSSSTTKAFENKQTASDDKNNGNDNHNDADSEDSAGGNDDDEMSSEFDVMGFYSNEDVLTTKELIDDMSRIMKDGIEIRRNQMNRKTKYVRRSHGACFTGADRYFILCFCAFSPFTINKSILRNHFFNIEITMNLNIVQLFPLQRRRNNETNNQLQN